jgi:hypothetical protein
MCLTSLSFCPVDVSQLQVKRDGFVSTFLAGQILQAVEQAVEPEAEEAETEEAGNSSCRVPMLITDVLQVVVSQLDLMVTAEVEHMFELCRARVANSGAQEEEEGLLARREGEYLDSDEGEDDDD